MQCIIFIFGQFAYKHIGWYLKKFTKWHGKSGIQKELKYKSRNVNLQTPFEGAKSRDTIAKQTRAEQTEIVFIQAMDA